MKSLGKETENFLSAIELVSRYDRTLRNMLETKRKGSVTYFSPRIQNETTNLAGRNIGKKLFLKWRNPNITQ
jgi:hypothetical protein